MKIKNYTQKTCRYCGTRIDAKDELCTTCALLDHVASDQRVPMNEEEPPEPKGLKETIPGLYTVALNGNTNWAVKASSCSEAIKKAKEYLSAEESYRDESEEWTAEELELTADVRLL